MSTNCLVTKLKGVVDNNNLDKLGQLKITVYHAENFTRPFLPLTFGYPVTLTIEGNGQIENVQGVAYPNPVTFNSSPNEQLFLSNPTEGETYNLFVSNKYNFYSYNEGNVKFGIKGDDFNYINTLANFIKRTNYGSGTYVVPETNNLRQLRNDSGGSVMADAENVIPGTIICLAGYYKISESKWNSVAPLLSEGSMSCEQDGYIPNMAIVGCAFFGNPETHTKGKWVGPRTLPAKTINDIDLGSDVDVMLKDLVNCPFTASPNINVYGTTAIDTDVTVQAALQQLIAKGFRDIRINNIQYVPQS